MRIAIVASMYNQRYVDGMLRAAKGVLKRAGVNAVEIVRVPGAFEIPVVASALAWRDEDIPDAVICLGLIIQGETSHADHIGSSVTQALTEIQVDSLVPMIHEVLLVKSEEQARVRCLSRDHNRGAEAANTALTMARLLRRICSE